jgi:hypothetical protein
MTRPAGAGGRWLLSALILIAVAACAGTDDDDGAAQFASRQSVSPPPEIKQQQLLGLDPDHLTGLLGPPDFKRDDGPAELWQYRDNECVLDVFLYVDPQQGGYRVALVEARDRSLVRAAPEGCVSALLRARRAQSAAQGAG